jgi:hypothetical protein
MANGIITGMSQRNVIYSAASAAPIYKAFRAHEGQFRAEIINHLLLFPAEGGEKFGKKYLTTGMYLSIMLFASIYDKTGKIYNE